MLKKVLVLSLFLLFASFAGVAQGLGTAGSVSGIVTDPNGAVVAGATVTLSNGVYRLFTNFHFGHKRSLSF